MTVSAQDAARTLRRRASRQRTERRRRLGRLARLRAELEVERGALDARRDETAELVQRWERDGKLPRAELVLVAANVHGYYTALEAALERIARLLDVEVLREPDWRTELLAQMRVEVPGLRPAIVPGELVSELHELRRFRHFYRNAYVLELDPDKVRTQADRLLSVHDALRASLDGLRAHLDAVIAELAG